MDGDGIGGVDLPVLPDLGYYQERDGSWVGFNAGGRMVPVASDDVALKGWLAQND